MKWYAVQVGDYDAWDEGSYDYDKAVGKGILWAVTEGESKFVLLTINEDTNFCEDAEEIELD